MDFILDEMHISPTREVSINIQDCKTKLRQTIDCGRMLKPHVQAIICSFVASTIVPDKEGHLHIVYRPARQQITNGALFAVPQNSCVYVLAEIDDLPSPKNTYPFKFPSELAKLLEDQFIDYSIEEH